MKKFALALAVSTTLAACMSQPEDRVEDTAFSNQVAASMTDAVPAAVRACVNLLATGTFATPELTRGGFRQEGGLAHNYTADLSEPYNFGLTTRPLRLQLNIGPSGSSLGVPGCKFQLDIRGNPIGPFVSNAVQTLEREGYSVTLRNRGNYTAVKDGSTILLNVSTTVGSGVRTTTASLRNG